MGGRPLLKFFNREKVDELVEAVIKIPNEDGKAEAIALLGRATCNLRNSTCSRLLDTAISIQDMTLQESALRQFDLGSMGDGQLGIDDKQRIKFIEAAVKLAKKGRLEALWNVVRKPGALNKLGNQLLSTMAKHMGVDESTWAKVLRFVDMTDWDPAECEYMARIGLAIKNEPALALVLEGLFLQLKLFSGLVSINDEIISAATKIDPSLRYKVFTALTGAGHLKQEQGESLVKAAKAIKSPAHQLRALACLGAELISLGTDRRAALINTALSIHNEQERVETLIILMRKMNYLKPMELHKNLFDKLNDIQGEQQRAFLLVNVADLAIINMSMTQHQEFMNVTRNIKDEIGRCHVLEQWINVMGKASLAEELRREIVLKSPFFSDEALKAKLLRALGTNLKDMPKDLQIRVLHATLDIADEGLRALALQGLASGVGCLPKKEVKRLFEAVTAIHDKEVRASALAAMWDVLTHL
jgi:hypothetical protein